MIIIQKLHNLIENYNKKNSLNNIQIIYIKSFMELISIFKIFNNL